MRAAILVMIVAACAACDAEIPDRANEVAPSGQPDGAGETPEPPRPKEPAGPGNIQGSSAETRVDPRSAEAAAQLLARYALLLGDRRFAAARQLWSDEGRSSGMSEQAFERHFASYEEIRAEIGTPGRLEGAAGSAYVEIPVRFLGRRGDRSSFSTAGTAVLRRVNDVPGSTARQREWRIYRIDVQPPL